MSHCPRADAASIAAFNDDDAHITTVFKPACPHCLSTDVRRSRWTNGTERRQHRLERPYRCRGCKRRFFVYRRRLVFGSILAAVLLMLGVGVASYLEFRDDVSGGLRAKRERDAGSAELLSRANAGDAEAQYLVAILMIEGKGGFQKSLAEAVKWLNRASERGHADAQLQLGLAFKSGNGILQDFGEAKRWFAKGASRGHAESQYQLGLLYRSGQGVPFDFVEAYAWFNRAASQGLQPATVARDELVTLMRPEQIAAAQARSRHDSAQPEDGGGTPAAKTGPTQGGSDQGPVAARSTASRPK
ncbi:MAG: hypothetical protein IOMNBAOH_01855 [Rhodocyclaceae bacterium]|nr:hypothetical protein [Rhodocyclaceae bacterium]